MGLIPPLLVLLLAVGVAHCGIAARKQFELRVQILELLARAVRRGMPLPALLRKAAIGQPRRVARVFVHLARDLEHGEDLGEALSWAAPDSFPPHVRAVVQAAEGTAELPDVLDALAVQSADSLAFRHRTAMALLYPLFLFLGLCSVQHFVVIMFRNPVLFASDPTAGWPSLPGVGAGRGAPHWFVLLTLGALISVTMFWRRMGFLRRVARELLQVVPRRSNAGRLLVASQFLDALAHVVRAGVALPTAMRRAVGAAGTGRAQERLEAAAKALEQGAPVADAWRGTGLPAFAVAAVQASSHGSTAQLADGLARAAREARRRYLGSRERLLELVHPALLFGLGGMIALNLAAVTRTSIFINEAYGLW